MCMAVGSGPGLFFRARWPRMRVGTYTGGYALKPSRNAL